MPARDFDVIAFGATSVTGRRVAAYLAERSEDTGLRWAAAARDAGKAERVLGEQGVEPPATLVADVGDPESLRQMARRTTAIVNLVGPYARYGEPVVKACVEAGSHYLDLTGEIPFARRIIDRYDAVARDAGIKVVQVCGYEALPPDLGVLLAAETARERFGERLVEVEMEASFTAWPPGPLRPSDTLSGGTLQSMSAAAGDPDAALLTDPAALTEDPAVANAIRATSPIRFRLRRGASGTLLAPLLPFAYINPAVIHQTAALVAAERGEKFDPFAYREGSAITAATIRPMRVAAAGIITGLQIAIAAASRARPRIRTRASAAISRALPSSGFGPAAERLDRWAWRLSLFTRTEGGRTIEVEIDGDGQPGYLSTARLIGEAGVAVAESGATPDRVGCLTPATALGTRSIDRFENAGVRFRLSA